MFASAVVGELSDKKKFLGLSLRDLVLGTILTLGDVGVACTT